MNRTAEMGNTIQETSGKVATIKKRVVYGFVIHSCTSANNADNTWRSGRIVAAPSGEFLSPIGRLSTPSASKYQPDHAIATSSQIVPPSRAKSISVGVR